MTRLMLAFVLFSMIIAGFVRADEHSALSEVFTLDTRYIPHSVGLEHSAMSGIFTLDTRDLDPDVDKNGTVGLSDLILVGNAFGTSVEGDRADVNRDGVVDIVDLVIVASRFNETTALSTLSRKY